MRRNECGGANKIVASRALIHTQTVAELKTNENGMENCMVIQYSDSWARRVHSEDNQRC